MQTNDEIEEIIKSAFKPYETRTKIYEYDGLLKFKVLKTDGTVIIERDGLNIDRMRDPNFLNDIIKTTRHVFQERGLDLEPWAFPK